MGLAWIVPVAGFAAVLFSFWLAWDVLRRDTGTPAMQDIAGMIFEGAMAFLRRQYGTIAMLAIVVAIVVGGVVALVSEGVKAIIFDGKAIQYGELVISPAREGTLTGIAFLLGAAPSPLPR